MLAPTEFSCLVCSHKQIYNFFRKKQTKNDRSKNHAELSAMRDHGRTFRDSGRMRQIQGRRTPNLRLQLRRRPGRIRLASNRQDVRHENTASRHPGTRCASTGSSRTNIRSEPGRKKKFPVHSEQKQPLQTRPRLRFHVHVRASAMRDLRRIDDMFQVREESSLFLLPPPPRQTRSLRPDFDVRHIKTRPKKKGAQD